VWQAHVYDSFVLDFWTMKTITGSQEFPEVVITSYRPELELELPYRRSNDENNRNDVRWPLKQLLFERSTDPVSLCLILPIVV
jgi:hypothetical protein